jgi:oligopeptide/dipeptide ABC transporter ATP-binding protein
MHPYTDALIRSIPAAQPGREWIEGAQEPVAEESASPARAGAGGCAYAARCPHATDRCRARAPGLYATREGTASACFLREAGAAIDGPGLADLLRG